MQSLTSLRLLFEPLPKVLLVPAALTGLHELSASATACPAAWVGQLSGLRQLRGLDLCVDADGAAEASADFPALPALSRLGLEVREHVTLRMCLPHLRALCSLGITGEGTADLSSPDTSNNTATVGHLTGLSLYVCYARVDFALMPALEVAYIDVLELDGAASIAAASALATLELGEDGELNLEGPCVAELLRHLPTSMRRMRIRGAWSGEAAEALGHVTQLRSLHLAGEDSPLPAADAPLWQGLTGLNWENNTAHVGDARLPPVSERCCMRLPALHHLYVRLCACFCRLRQAQP